MTFDPLENVHFHSNLASSAGFDVFEMLHKKLENVFARPFLSHRRVCFGAQIRVEMDGCKQMKVLVAHRRIWLHPRCFHESNENQAKEPFSSSGRSRAQPKQEFTKKFVLVSKTEGWDRCLQRIIIFTRTLLLTTMRATIDFEKILPQSTRYLSSH
jgi:hypothetical protein